MPDVWKLISLVSISKPDGGTRPPSVAAAAWGSRDDSVGQKNLQIEAQASGGCYARIIEAMEVARCGNKCLMGAKLDL